MADTKLSALTAAGTLDGTELVYVVQGGVSKRTTIAALTDSIDSWHTVGSAGEPALENGWTYAGSGPVTAFFRDAVGGVHVKGRVTGGTSQVFTLPAGYRPADTLQYPVTDSTGGLARVTVFNDGRVTPGGNTGWVNITVYFPAA